MRPGLVLAPILAYYATTLAIWFGHWFSHLRIGPFRDDHVLGHHALYPSADALLSGRFLYSKHYNSNRTLAPPLIALALGEFLFLSKEGFAIAFVTTAVTASWVGYLHTRFHVAGTHLERFEGFLWARRAHAIHHDQNANFMVADHFWDRALGCYRSPEVPRGRGALHRRRGARR